MYILRNPNLRDVKLFCDRCTRLSMVFYRVRGIGTVPLNLRELYDVSANGRPRRAA